MWSSIRIVHFYLRLRQLWPTGNNNNSNSTPSSVSNWNRSKASLARVISIAPFASTNSWRYRFLSRFGALTKYGGRTFYSVEMSCNACAERESYAQLFSTSIVPLCGYQKKKNGEKNFPFHLISFYFFSIFFSLCLLLFSSGNMAKFSCWASIALSISFRGMTWTFIFLLSTHFKCI